VALMMPAPTRTTSDVGEEGVILLTGITVLPIFP
jgi:hypothetical protein